MADISLIEFGVYGFIAYSSMLMLIISSIRDIPITKALSIIRAIYLFPGVVAAGILAQTGPNIITSNVQNTITSLNTTEVWTETIVSQYPLQNEVWSIFHIFIMLVLMVHVMTQVLMLMTKHE